MDCVNSGFVPVCQRACITEVSPVLKSPQQKNNNNHHILAKFTGLLSKNKQESSPQNAALVPPSLPVWPPEWPKLWVCGRSPCGSPTRPAPPCPFGPGLRVSHRAPVAFFHGPGLDLLGAELDPTVSPKKKDKKTDVELECHTIHCTDVNACCSKTFDLVWIFLLAANLCEELKPSLHVQLPSFDLPVSLVVTPSIFEATSHLLRTRHPPSRPLLHLSLSRLAL